MTNDPSTSKETPAAAELLRRHGTAVKAYLRSLRGRYADAPPRLLDAIDYSLLGGGKRLRPTLVLECARACGAAEHTDTALAAAAAVELIHTFSLVHDDLPAMDDDDLRRGRATNHKVFGEAMAILAGDAMVTIAFEVLARAAEPGRVGPLVRELAAAAGPAGMIGGQVLDIDGENAALPLAELRRVHRMKTGALLTAACRMGAITAGVTGGEPRLDAVTEYGQRLGLSFQIVDDLLDVTATPEQLGKATGKDKVKGKNTYPNLLGVDGARAEAQTQLQGALNAIRPLGRAGDGLAALARFVVDRRS